MNSTRKITCIMVSVLLMTTLACNLLTTVKPSEVPTTEATTPPKTLPPQQIQTPTSIQTPISPQEVYAPPFAVYQPMAVKLPSRFNGGYSLPLDLSQVQGINDFNLSDSQKQGLAQTGFVVNAPMQGKYKFNEFYQLYENYRYSEQPIFITTDAVYHVYHLIFDKMLRDLEQEHFIATLETLTLTMMKATLAQYQELKGTPLEEQARRNLSFFAVPAQLLSLPEPIPEAAKDLVEAELALILEHASPQISPIWDRPDLPDDKKLIEDYTQYVPRGHYTRSEALERYFRAMMWYGRMTYRLRDDFETQRALLLTQAIRNAKAQDGTSALQLWQLIYEPTVFIVGKADDLSFQEYGVLSDKIFGLNPSPTVFADANLLSQFKAAAKQLPPPQINSMWVWIWEDKEQATKGFRFMGQRFTLDEYVFGQLIFRNVGTLDNPRALPKGLDFFAALGSEEALNILEELGETAYLHYPEQMAKVRREIASLQIDSWTQNLYWSWLYALHPLVTPKGDQYPAFMQTQAWTRKDLNTALGSWTELKHDTILYAKQVMAEMGAGQPEQPPRGYVEPNPEAFTRLLALARMTYDGLNQRNLLTDLTRGNLENLMDLLSFLKTAAERELAGEALSEDDYWRIQYFGGELEALTVAASDCEPPSDYCYDIFDQKAALIADVATGYGNVLEEAIGHPTEIYVVLPDQPWRIAVGGVFTYYEFTVPDSQRMTDEQWRSMLESGANPPPPD